MIKHIITHKLILIFNNKVNNTTVIIFYKFLLVRHIIKHIITQVNFQALFIKLHVILYTPTTYYSILPSIWLLPLRIKTFFRPPRFWSQVIEYFFYFLFIFGWALSYIVTKNFISFIFFYKYIRTMPRHSCYVQRIAINLHFSKIYF